MQSQTVFTALTASDSETLLFMREEEKLARDVYLSLYHAWRLPIFSNIAAAEQRHTDQVKRLLENYGLPDPVSNDQIGVFQNPELSALYQELVNRGSTSVAEALQVGALIEEKDIEDLQQAIQATNNPELARVYSRLMQGSHNHLRAFTGQIRSRGVAYEAQVLLQQEVEQIVQRSASCGSGGQGGGRGQGRRGAMFATTPLTATFGENAQQPAQGANGYYRGAQAQAQGCGGGMGRHGFRGGR